MSSEKNILFYLAFKKKKPQINKKKIIMILIFFPQLKRLLGEKNVC